MFDTAGGLWSATDPNTAEPVQVILNVRTGDTDYVMRVGVGDEVWFNAGDNNYYTASSTSPLRPLDLSPPSDAQGAAILGVIDARDEAVLQLVPTFNVPAVTGTGAHPSSSAHSVAGRREEQPHLRAVGRQQRLPQLLDRLHRRVLAWG